MNSAFYSCCVMILGIHCNRELLSTSMVLFAARAPPLILRGTIELQNTEKQDISSEYF